MEIGSTDLIDKVLKSEGLHSLIHTSSYSEDIEKFKFLIQDLSAVGDDGTSQTAAKVKMFAKLKS